MNAYLVRFNYERCNYKEIISDNSEEIVQKIKQVPEAIDTGELTPEYINYKTKSICYAYIEETLYANDEEEIVKVAEMRESQIKRSDFELCSIQCSYIGEKLN